jgi:hypothetical protein
MLARQTAIIKPTAYGELSEQRRASCHEAKRKQLRRPPDIQDPLLQRKASVVQEQFSTARHCRGCPNEASKNARP